ncbi:hypothetical protein NE848_01270 [Gramella jeungdoensis]|uniref:AI-2E family transporter n=1 Tax=Gramella jeungdoensis TaxID=708091 RepID=A0ABT0YX15_9FLAO|nr:hypothetical protein [Gramella jeungdoensis]MCM8567994.1 hypothetical protein [Gramella jeungdoensis]
MADSFNIASIVSWIFAVFVLPIGLLNLFRGNDPGLGMTYVAIAVIYFPPVNILMKDLFRFSISYYIKVILGLILIWVTLAGRTIAEGYYPKIIDSL